MLRSVRQAASPPSPKESIADALARQASDVAAARRALDDATGLARGLWFSFITFSAYLAIAVGAVTHRDLFLENPVKLPLLNVDLPLVAFFWIAPILLLVFHGYLLLNLKLLADNVRKWEELTSAGLQELESADERAAVADGLRLQLPNFVVVQMLAAPRGNRRGMVGAGLSLAVAVTIVVAPVLLLCEMLLQFLPYHSDPVTMTHRLALVADIAMIAYFWRGVVGDQHWTLRRKVTVPVGIASTLLLVLAFAFATFPGGALHKNAVARATDAAFVSFVCGAEYRFVAFQSDRLDCTSEFSDFQPLTLSQLIFEAPVNGVTGQRRSWFSNTLILPNQDFVAQSDKDLAEIETTLSLRGRHLEGAVLSRADLLKADFTGAHLEAAIFDRARLDSARFLCEDTGAGRQCADLQGVWMIGASLRGALLDGAWLQGAVLNVASLQGASMDNALLQGARLGMASVEGASLNFASLQGALLSFASLQGASLVRASLQGASIEGASLEGVSIEGASLTGDSLASGGKFFDSAVYDAFVEQMTFGIDNDDVRARLLEALAVLDPDLRRSDGTMTDDEAKTFQSVMQEQIDTVAHANTIKTLACENDAPPFVTNRLIRSTTGPGMINYIEGQSAAIATHILDGLDAGTCPGAVGISDEAMAQLRDWAPDWKPKAMREKAATSANR